MMDNEDLKQNQEDEINLLEIAQKLWSQRMRFVKWCAVGAVLGLIIGFSIPKEYSTSVKLAPESNDGKSISGGLSALASMAGFGGALNSGSDAVSPILYPDIVSSIPFLTGLFDVKVPLNTEEYIEIPLKTYLEDDIRTPWWGYIFGLPKKIITLLKSNDEDEKGHKLNNFKLTQKENLIVEELASRISTTIDTKTSVITVSVQMQDPLVSAVLADTVVARLQDFITDYRTSKARKDLEYAQLLNNEAKENYYKAQQKYAEYLDSNNGTILHSVQTTRERLENEASLAFNLYNQTAQQVQLAQAKVQETTPVYTVVSPATVPIRASSPRKFLILVGFIFLAAVACAFWILFVPTLKEQFAHAGEKVTEEVPAKNE